MTHYSNAAAPTTPQSPPKKKILVTILRTPRIHNKAKAVDSQPPQLVDHDGGCSMLLSPTTESAMNAPSYRYISQHKMVAPCSSRPKEVLPLGSSEPTHSLATPMSPNSQVKQIFYRRWFPKGSEAGAKSPGSIVAKKTRATRPATQRPKSPLVRCRRLLFGTNETATYQSNEPSTNILLTGDRWNSRSESFVMPPKQPHRQGSCRRLANESAELLVRRFEAPL